VIDEQISLLNSYRQSILELIRKGDAGQSGEDAAFWMKKVCDLGCEVRFGKETSVKILEDISQSIKVQLTELRTLYADSSFYV
jgi:hypothetical protein